MKNVKKFSLPRVSPRLFIDVVEAGNFQPLLVNSKMKRIGALSRSSGVSLKGQ